MAAPVTHIIFAQKVFASHFFAKKKAEFIVGTSFPDIRYLGIIKREETHLSPGSLREINEEDSFLAGVKLHVYIDRVREEYITKRGVYEFIPETRYAVSALKLLEDRYLYNKLSNWKEISIFFDDIYKEELSFNLSEDSIKNWHAILQRLIGRQPDDTSIVDFCRSLSFSENAIGELISTVNKFENIKEVKNILLNFYDKFPDVD